MFREKVTVLDALTAIMLVESSTQYSSDGNAVNALHTVLSENPYEEYERLGTIINY